MMNTTRGTHRNTKNTTTTTTKANTQRGGGCRGWHRKATQTSHAKTHKKYSNTRARSVSEQTGSTGSLYSGGNRVVNFSAGPACIYEDVLLQAQAELLNYGVDTGLSVMEMSHRGAAFTDIRNRAEEDLRELLNISDDYTVLFMQGGASTQFAAIPLNLAFDEGQPAKADYVVTGSWSKKAAAEAKKLGIQVNIAATGDNKSIPDSSSWQFGEAKDTAYVHICANETIQGVEFKSPPAGIPAGVPLIADMSSNFCSKPLNVNDYGVIYAGAQKNIGPAGVTIAIVRKDLLGKAREDTPTMLDWGVMDESRSLYNTPPCFAIYMCGLVFSKLKSLGGLEKVEQINKTKCALIYDVIAQSGGFYDCPVDVRVRSAMNVPFTIPSRAELEKDFIKGAEQEGLVNLKGHRSVGGMRASIYNAMPLEGVQKLVNFMQDFQARHQ